MHKVLLAAGIHPDLLEKLKCPRPLTAAKGEETGRGKDKE